MIWSKPKTLEDCYFCMTKKVGSHPFATIVIEYAHVSSVTRPTLANVPILTEEAPRCENLEHSENEIYETDDKSAEESNYSEDEYSPHNEKKKKEPQLFNQEDLDDLIRRLGLAKDSAELLATELKRRSLVTKDTKSTVYRQGRKI